jgi:hypothetical protein
MPSPKLAGQGVQSVAVELTTAQVDQVVRAATQGGAMSILLMQRGFRAEFACSLGEWPLAELNEKRLSRSLLMGLWILALLPDDGSWVGLGPLSSRAALSKSTAHRYVTTLVAVGLAEREPITRKYRLAGLVVEHG